MSDGKNLKDEVRDVKEKLVDISESRSKRKRFKLPRKSRVKKKKIREGWATVCVVKDNKAVDFQKVRLDGGTYKLDNDDTTYHVSNADDIYFYNGKPIIFQPKKKQNPVNLLEGKDETYGHEQIMDRMTGDAVKQRKSSGDMGKYILIGIAAIIIIYIVMQYV